MDASEYTAFTPAARASVSAARSFCASASSTVAPRATTSVMPSASPQVSRINASSRRVDSVMPLSLAMSPSKRSRPAPKAAATVSPSIAASNQGRPPDCQV